MVTRPRSTSTAPSWFTTRNATIEPPARVGTHAHAQPHLGGEAVAVVARCGEAAIDRPHARRIAVAHRFDHRVRREPERVLPREDRPLEPGLLGDRRVDVDRVRVVAAMPVQQRLLLGRLVHDAQVGRTARRRAIRLTRPARTAEPSPADHEQRDAGDERERAGAGVGRGDLESYQRTRALVVDARDTRAYCDVAAWGVDGASSSDCEPSTS